MKRRKKERGRGEEEASGDHAHHRWSQEQRRLKDSKVGGKEETRVKGERDTKVIKSDFITLILVVFGK